jgi:RNA polymerase sigma factor (sigma-70 family)
VLVCEQIERCRHPGAFLAFALYKLQHALQQERRARGKDWPVGELDQESTDEDIAAFRLRLARQERLQVVVEALRRLQDERQQKTIAFKFLEGLSDEEIATHLGIAVGYVRVLRHRGLARLRKDKQLRECLELGDGEEI